MAKNNKPMEQMKLTIEFADNGIILRNPDYIDEVTLALTLESVGGEGKKTDWHAKEYRAIGKKIYDWLTCVAIQEHVDYVCTGAELNIVATLNGREV